MSSPEGPGPWQDHRQWIHPSIKSTLQLQERLQAGWSAAEEVPGQWQLVWKRSYLSTIKVLKRIYFKSRFYLASKSFTFFKTIFIKIILLHYLFKI